MKINKRRRQGQGQQRNVVKYLHFGGCSTDALCASLLPLACCQLPQSVACSINKMSEMHCERERKRERVNDVVTGGASRLVVRFLGMTDIWLVLTWTQFLTFILLGFLHNANGRATDNIQHPFSIHSASIQHHVSMCQSVSQSVNVCISQFQISASAAVAASL